MDKMGSESGTLNPENSVDSVEKSLPNSKKIYVPGKLHPDIRVPLFVMSSGVETSLTISETL